MKVAVLSDIHDHVQNLERVLDQVQDAGVLVCCGDLCSPFTLDTLAKGFSGPVHVTFGNNDGDILLLTRIAAKHPHVTLAAPFGQVEAGGRPLAFIHYPELGEGLAALGRYDAVFVGHTHLPEVRTVGKTVLANPGEVMGRLVAPGYGIYDTETHEFRRHEL